MVSDVARTSRSHEESRYSANDKSSKYKLFESSENAGNIDADANALLQVIEILLKEIRSLRNQIKLDDYNKESGDERKSHRSAIHGARLKTCEIKKARQAENPENIVGASSHNQCSYADVCRKNIHINEVNAEKAEGKSHRLEDCVESLDSAKINLRECRYCGLRHVFGANKCKAFGKSCYKCNKMNHFGRVCWDSTKAYRRKEKSAKAHVAKEEVCKIDIQSSMEISDREEINAKVAEASDEKECLENEREVKAGDVSEVEQIVVVVKSYEKATDAPEQSMDVGAAAVKDVSQNCMEKKDKVLEWKEIMEKDIRSFQKAEKIMEDKAEKQSWLDIEDGTKFPLWAAYIKANPQMKVQFPEKGGCDVFSI